MKTIQEILFLAWLFSTGVVAAVLFVESKLGDFLFEGLLSLRRRQAINRVKAEARKRFSNRPSETCLFCVGGYNHQAEKAEPCMFCNCDEWAEFCFAKEESKAKEALSK